MKEGAGAAGRRRRVRRKGGLSFASFVWGDHRCGEPAAFPTRPRSEPRAEPREARAPAIAPRRRARGPGLGHCPGRNENISHCNADAEALVENVNMEDVMITLGGGEGEEEEKRRRHGMRMRRKGKVGENKK